MKSEDTVKISLRLDPRIYAAIQNEAAAQGREVGEHMQRLFTEHVIGHNLIDEATTRELKLRDHLVLRAVEVGQTILREEGFTPNIPEKTFKRCEADKPWLIDYETYIGDNPYKRGNARKGSLNQEIGAAIRKGLGGIVAKDGGGKPIKFAVLDSIIQSYTRWESCAPMRSEQWDGASPPTPGI